MSDPVTETRRVMRPFGELVVAAIQLVRDLTDEDLATLRASPACFSLTNCSWAEYEAAFTPWLQREAVYEQKRRQDLLRIHAAEEGAS